MSETKKCTKCGEVKAFIEFSPNEVNVAKVRMATLDAGKTMGEVSHLGKLLIGDDSTPTLSGS